MATLLKEFFRDLPEPILPKDLQPALLAIHSKYNLLWYIFDFQLSFVIIHRSLESIHDLKRIFLEMSNPQDQISNVQRLLQILPVVNRDTLFVLLQFLGLVAENSDDRKAEDGKLY